jgi:MFS family permease
MDTLQEPEETTGAEDTPQIGILYRSSFLLASMVAGLSSVCIKQLLLPLQVSLIDPGNTNMSFAIVSVIGAVAGLAAAPLTGALADRSTSSLGRRRTWLLGGMIIGVVGLSVMAWSTTIPLLIVGEILEQLGIEAILSNVTALIPDQIPEQQQATTSALNGMAPVVGGTVGLMLVVFFTNTHIVAQGYTLLACASLLCVGIFLLILKEQPLTQEQVAPFHLGTFLVSFVRPIRSRDFVYTLVSRLLVFLPFTMIGSYLLYYLKGTIQASTVTAARGVTAYQLLSTLMLIVAALLSGYLSNRTGRIKPFVVLGAIIMALALLILSLFPNWIAVYIAGATFGCGFGLYLGVDVSLAIKVLPDVSTSGKDLGIIYTSIFIPLILTPIIGVTALKSFHAFGVFFTIAIVSAIAAAILILPIKVK